MAVDYAIIACLVFLESLSHLSSIPPYGSIPVGDACPSSEFQKQYWRSGHTHVAVGILLYCIAIFDVAVTVSTYFHVICQQLHLSYVAVLRPRCLSEFYPIWRGHDYEYDTWYDYEHIQPSSILKYYERPPLLSSFLLSSVTYVLFWTISRKKIMYIYTYPDPDISFNDASNSIYNESIGDNSVQGCVFVGNICCLSHSLP